MQSKADLTGVAAEGRSGETIDANALERMARERPGECFLKGSGVLKLIGGLRQLERRLRQITSLATWDEHGAVAPAIEGLSWESVARMALDLARAKVVAAQASSAVDNGSPPADDTEADRAAKVDERFNPRETGQ